MIYLIGGPSRAGKSSVRKYLLKNYGISGLETDSLRTTIEIAQPELGIHYQKAPQHNAMLMEPFIKAFIKSRFFFDEDYVFEGDCITPTIIKYFEGNSRVKAVCIGYPNMTLENKFKQVRAIAEGWTAHVTDDELKQKIINFISDSQQLEIDCNKYNVPFVNTSFLSINEIIEQSVDYLGFMTAKEDRPSFRGGQLSRQ